MKRTCCAAYVRLGRWPPWTRWPPHCARASNAVTAPGILHYLSRKGQASRFLKGPPEVFLNDLKFRFFHHLLGSCLLIYLVCFISLLRFRIFYFVYLISQYMNVCVFIFFLCICASVWFCVCISSAHTRALDF